LNNVLLVSTGLGTAGLGLGIAGLGLGLGTEGLDLGLGLGQPGLDNITDVFSPKSGFPHIKLTSLGHASVGCPKPLWRDEIRLG
jgi:hypothetical protein